MNQLKDIVCCFLFAICFYLLLIDGLDREVENRIEYDRANPKVRYQYKVHMGVYNRGK